MTGRVLSSELPHLEGRRIRLAGWVHRIRDLGGVRFLILRDRAGLAQAVVPGDLDMGDVGCEWVIALEGDVRREARAPRGYEVLAERLEAISPAQTPPVEIFRPPEAAGHRLQTLLDNRAVSLRIPEVLDVFRVQAEILRAFRSYMRSQGFAEIKTPKLVLAGAEGGSSVFEVKYFDGKAYLGQSPQFYKQIMVGSGLERVFEVGQAYRAEKSETSRHTTEFVSLDFEMGFIESEQDVIDMHAGLMRAIFAAVSADCGGILARRGLRLPEAEQIPQITFPQAKRVLAERFGKTEGLSGDLDTEGERLICEWAERELASDLLYVTGYAMAKRPAYTMPKPEDPSLSRSFDLLYKGVEVTTGSQRIHDYGQLLESFGQRRIDPATCQGYLSAFRHGMPPHGGMGMGLERLTKQMLNLANIREACLFPRDRNRLTP
jgi:nondiscriminating aspartyl-tRNA synthetase